MFKNLQYRKENMHVYKFWTVQGQKDPHLVIVQMAQPTEYI